MGKERQQVTNFDDFQWNNCIFLNIMHLKNTLQESSYFNNWSRKFSIFAELITHLHAYNIHLEKSALENSVVLPPATKKVLALLILDEITFNLSNELQRKKNLNFADLLWNNHVLHDQSQKISHLGNYVLCFDFMDSLQNHCLFYQSPAYIVHILKIWSVLWPAGQFWRE